MSTVDIGDADLTDFGTDKTKFPPLGTPFQQEGAWYAAVYNAGADTAVAGEFCSPFNTTPVNGHVSVTGATMLDNGTAGVMAGKCMSAAPTLNYFFVQCGGYASDALTDGGVAAGEHCVMDGGTTPSGALDTMADGEEECVCFVADAADSGTAGSGYILNSVFMG